MFCLCRHAEATPQQADALSTQLQLTLAALSSVHMSNCLQAMNGSRSAELSGSDAILDSTESDPAPHLHMSGVSEHAAEPTMLLPQAELVARDVEAAQQQPSSSGEAERHRPAASWQQSEGSMQEVASTSGSSESGQLVCLTWLPKLDADLWWDCIHTCCSTKLSSDASALM